MAWRYQGLEVGSLMPGSSGDSPVSAASVVRVIAVRVCRGAGTAEDPKRIVIEYWSMDGLLLAVRDIHRDGPDSEVEDAR